MAEETLQFLLRLATHLDERESRRARLSSSPRASRAFTLNYDTAVCPPFLPPALSLLLSHRIRHRVTDCKYGGARTRKRGIEVCRGCKRRRW